MFETFGTKYDSYLMQVVTVEGNEYLMKRDGSVYMREENLPEVKDEDIISKVQEQAAGDGGWNVG